MDAPPVHYARTSDGVSVAYCVAGNGRPLVVVPNPVFTHVQKIWDVFPYFHHPLAQFFRLVWYDSRGSGLSDRSAIDFSMEAMVRDLEAVVEPLGVEAFALCGWDVGASIAMTYAAMRGERVSSLILIDGAADWHRAFRERKPVAEFDLALRERDMFLYTETLSKVLMPFKDVEAARRWAELILMSAEPRAFWASCAAADSYDVSALLPHVTARTLVLSSRNNPFITVEAGRQLTASISDARLVVLDDLVCDYATRVAREIRRFLFVPEADAPFGAPPAGLTAREVGVLRLLALGMSSREAAERLSLSVRTVERHTSNIYLKLGIHTRAEATAFAIERGLLADGYRSHSST